MPSSASRGRSGRAADGHIQADCTAPGRLHALPRSVHSPDVDALLSDDDPRALPLPPPASAARCGHATPATRQSVSAVHRTVPPHRPVRVSLCDPGHWSSFLAPPRSPRAFLTAPAGPPFQPASFPCGAVPSPVCGSVSHRFCGLPAGVCSGFGPSRWPGHRPPATAESGPDTAPAPGSTRPAPVRSGLPSPVQQQTCLPNSSLLVCCPHRAAAVLRPVRPCASYTALLH